MSNALKKAAIYFGFAEEDELTQEVRPVERTEEQDRHDRAPQPRERVEEPRRAPVTKLRPAQKVSDMSEILTVHPRQYKDAKAIAEAFRDGTPVIINLSQMTDGDARRLIDFSAGLTQGLEGRIERVTTKVYLLTPEHIAVSGGRSVDEDTDSAVFAH
ncbi:cell division inhibitor SepF [Agrococcus sp. UYP10]|jgi:cell division inhibitor SepF|uniref:Cell division protein SepF n=1 Tax=Agrococcus jenensis TaxID=46353 RepID=A0A3N2AUG8_9MICO|nr:cell division protein SepF [Agrococcus jenensis]ROR66674.1 cell division inhibitor SepF [Agrococcus jenensis]